MLVKNAMQVSDIHTRPTATLREAAELMIRLGVTSLAVVSKGRLVGVIRLADLLTAPLPAHYQAHASERRDEAQLLETWKSLEVQQIMNNKPIAVSEDMPLMKAVALMINQDRQQLPVLREEKVVGMLTRADVVRTLLMAKNV